MTNQEQYDVVWEKAKKYESMLETLKKIKKQIKDEADYAYADFEDYKQNILEVEAYDLPNDDFRYGMYRALEIILFQFGGVKWIIHTMQLLNF